MEQSTEQPVVTSETERRLLEAAGEVFAARGFRGATVREICHLAKANVAAVNYHYGDKMGLYQAVLKHAYYCSRAKYPSGLSEEATMPPEQRLTAYIESQLLRIFDEGEPAWHGKLEAREMIEPTPALDSLVEEQIRPRNQKLQSVIRTLLGPGADDQLVTFCVNSVIGQCLFYHHSRPVIARLYPQQQYQHRDIQQMAAHITRFSLAAIKSLAEELRRTSGSALQSAGSTTGN